MDSQLTSRYGRFKGTGAEVSSPGEGGQRRRSYVLDPEKAKVIDFAIQLGRPLLVEGEAGCGKTRLADLISEDLGLEKPPYIVSVRSTSRANDLLYRYDALRRLQDSQLRDDESTKRAKKARNYVKLQPLGLAIKEGWRRVVVIDEIDKADPDVPNDLLHVLEQFEFTIDEIPESLQMGDGADGPLRHRVTGPTGERPIIVFTSNRERQLPKPFLRRCIFLELTFPENEADLAEIVKINLTRPRPGVSAPSISPENLSESLVSAAIESFRKIRDVAAMNNAYKKPATSELIDWIHVLHWEPEGIADQLRQPLPPHWRMLFSTGPDADTYRRSAESARPKESGA